MWPVLVVLFQVVSGNITQETTIGDLYSDYNNSSVTTFSTDIYSASEFSSENDCNSSTCPNATTSPILEKTTLPIETFKKKRRDFSGTACLCDLLRNVCDVNCCCDEDCNYEKKSIFDHCESIDSPNIDRRSCIYVERGYVNFTLYEWDIQNNDLFCVVRSNVPPSRIIQKNEIFDNYEESLLEKDMRYDWPERILDVQEGVNYSVSYAQGLPVWVILDNSTINPLEISEALISSGCNIQSEVKYLYDVHNECVHAVKKENNYLSSDYYTQLLFVARPNTFNYTKLQNKLLACPKPTCLKTKTKICSDINLRNCTDNNLTEASFRCSHEAEETICENIVKSLKFILYHEGSKGLKEVDVFMHLVNATFESTKQYELEQSISVEFQWADSPKNFSNILGGNPGYVVQRPILIGVSINGTISRNPDNFKDNFMVLPDEDMGVCNIGKYSYQPIEFGYSTLLMCEIRGSIATRKNSKPTDLCKKLQLEIFKYWSIEESRGNFVNKTFGYFGNANLSITEDWKEIMYEKSPRYIQNHIIGEYGNTNRTLICAGLAHGLNIDIYHARVDLKRLADQEKILGVTHQFQSIHNESLSFSLSHYKLSYEFFLDTRVTFWDITSPKVRKLVDPPSLNIKLPSDFFYPFVKVGNGCCNFVVFQSQIFVFCLINFSIFYVL